MTQRLLVLFCVGWLLAGCSRGLAGSYVRESPNGTLTLTLADGGFKLANSNNSEVLSGTYAIKDNLLTLTIEKRSGQSLPVKERAQSPPLLIKDGGKILQEDQGSQFVKQ